MTSVSRQRAWQLANAEKARAQRLAYKATQNGTLIRPSTCSKCPNSNPQSHHEDYSKPLEVVWLCSYCHAQRHAEMRAPVRAARREAQRKANAEAARRRREERRTVEYLAWRGEVSAAGQRTIPAGTLIAHLRAVADETGYVSQQMYNAAYQASIGTAEKLPCTSAFEIRFGSWSQAVAAAGLRSGNACRTYSRTSDERLIECVAVAMGVVGHLPTVAEYERIRRERPDLKLVSRALIERRIRGWATVLGLAVESLGRDEKAAA